MQTPPNRRDVRIDPLPYVNALATRELGDIDLVVIHCTELPDLALAREFGERVLYADSGTGNSGHYYIERDGLLIVMLGGGDKSSQSDDIAKALDLLKRLSTGDCT